VEITKTALVKEREREIITTSIIMNIITMGAIDSMIPTLFVDPISPAS
jgi:hypothetical protein